MENIFFILVLVADILIAVNIMKEDGNRNDEMVRTNGDRFKLSDNDYKEIVELFAVVVWILIHSAMLMWLNNQLIK